MRLSVTTPFFLAAAATLTACGASPKITDPKHVASDMAEAYQKIDRSYTEILACHLQKDLPQASQGRKCTEYDIFERQIPSFEAGRSFTDLVNENHVSFNDLANVTMDCKEAALEDNDDDIGRVRLEACPSSNSITAFIDDVSFDELRGRPLAREAFERIGFCRKTYAEKITGQSLDSDDEEIRFVAVELAITECPSNKLLNFSDRLNLNAFIVGIKYQRLSFY